MRARDTSNDLGTKIRLHLMPSLTAGQAGIYYILRHKVLWAPTIR